MFIAALLAGCGGKVIDADELEDEIKTQAEAAGLVIDEVSCPEVDAEEGETFTCDVTIKGEETEIEVEQQDDEGNVTFNLGALVESGGAAGGTTADEASITTTIETIAADPESVCDFATEDFKPECENFSDNRSVAPLTDYEIEIDGTTATATGMAPDDAEVVYILQRAEDMTWQLAGLSG